MCIQIKAIKEEIVEIKKQLLAIGEMRPGSLSKQKRSRGNLYHQLSSDFLISGKIWRYRLRFSGWWRMQAFEDHPEVRSGVDGFGFVEVFEESSQSSVCCRC